MLIIASEDKYGEFCSSGIQKPSDFCIKELGYKDVKKRGFIQTYFSDPAKLTAAIVKYHGIHKRKNNEVTLYDLLKPPAKV